MDPNATEFVPAEVWKQKYEELSEENLDNKILVSSLEEEMKQKEKLISALKSTIDNHMSCNDILRVKTADAERLVNIRNRALRARCDELDELRCQFHDVKERNKRIMIEQKTMIEELEKDVSEWQKKSMRLQYIIEQMNRVGAIRLPEHEWALDMADEIKFPDGSAISVYNVVPYELRQEWLPSATDNVEIVDEVEQSALYMHLSEEARAHSELETLNSLLVRLGELRPEVSVDATTIQRMWRGYRCRYIYPKVKAAICLQRIWRGYKSRGIRYYERPFPLSQSNRFTLRDSLRIINTSGEYTYEIIFLRGDIIATMLPRNTYKLKVIETYAKDQWKVRCVQTGEEKYFRVPSNVSSGWHCSIRYVFDVATGISINYTHEVHEMLEERCNWYSAPNIGNKRSRHHCDLDIPFFALKIKNVDGKIKIGRLGIKEVEDELDEDFTHGMFA